MTNDKKNICPICKKHEHAIVVSICNEAKEYVLKRIRLDHPEWIEKDGLCTRCKDYYEKL
ncbi:MAG: hypothetical protein KBA46_03540 [Candidatus Omnitrophica bacterium]|nr:hypothetical protein [Candidatus Omnitrophota bacterium]